MTKRQPVEIDRTDLSTLLGSLASDLRNAGLAVRGLGYGRSEPGEEECRDLERLAESLCRIASTLDGARSHLCRKCGLLDVSEQILLAEPS